jgi:hypothetical protein
VSDEKTDKQTFRAMPPLDAPDATFPWSSIQTTPTVSITQSWSSSMIGWVNIFAFFTLFKISASAPK